MDPNEMHPGEEGTMYKSFRVENFRLFKDFSIEDFDRVNLIAGKNDVGKTALLEALFMHMGRHNPMLPLTVTAWRGIEEFKADAEQLWGWLFYEGRFSEPIRLTGKSSRGDTTTLSVRLSPTGDGTPTSITRAEETTPTAETWQLLMDYREHGKRIRSRAFVESGEVKFERGVPQLLPTGIFVTTTRLRGQDPERLSKLELVNRQDEVVRAIRLIEPALKRLSVLAIGPKPLIHADTGLERLIPVTFMGEGVGRLLSMVLAIYSAPDGFVLIDEVENGLHYTALKNVWSIIKFASRKAKVQVFATTHSLECVRAAYDAFSEILPEQVGLGLDDKEDYGFRFFRLDRDREGVKAVSYNQEALAAALKAELEVR